MYICIWHHSCLKLHTHIHTNTVIKLKPANMLDSFGILHNISIHLYFLICDFVSFLIERKPIQMLDFLHIKTESVF